MKHGTSKWYEIAPALVDDVIDTDYKRLRMEMDGELFEMSSAAPSLRSLQRNANDRDIEVVRFYTYLERVK